MRRPPVAEPWGHQAHGRPGLATLLLEDLEATIASGPCVRGQPLTAPWVMPLTICLPKMAVTMTRGTVAMTVPARMTEMSGV